VRGLSVQEAVANLDRLWDVQYAVTGVYTDMLPYLVSCHVWGLNFESRSTAAYNKLGQQLLPAFEADVQQYYDRVFELIANAAQRELLGGGERTVRVPMFGLGQFLNALDAERSSIVRAAWARGFRALADSGVTAVLCAPAHIIPNQLRGFAAIDNLFDVMQLQPNTMLVNAWDSHSFIGNGGALDQTIDGQYVAQATSYNMIINVSSLHNLAVLFPQYLRDFGERRPDGTHVLQFQCSG
jgi:hypothetical protein